MGAFFFINITFLYIFFNVNFYKTELIVYGKEKNDVLVPMNQLRFRGECTVEDIKILFESYLNDYNQAWYSKDIDNKSILFLQKEFDRFRFKEVDNNGSYYKEI